MEAALDDGIIAVNPCHVLARKLGLGKRRQQTEEEAVKPFSREEANLFLETARRVAPRYYPLFLTLYSCGLRVGEGFGLKDADVNLDRRKIHVQRSIDSRTKRVGTTKGGKARYVDMSQELVACLKKHRAQEAQRALREGWGERPEWVFSTSNRTPYPYSPTRKAFVKVLESAKLPLHHTIHSLRHTFATLHLTVDPGRLLYVSRQMGHKSVAITADTYAAWLQTEDTDAADSLATDAWRNAQA
jgi:integrase